jgi:hypothetical protein
MNIYPKNHAMKYMRLKQLESCRDCSRQLTLSKAYLPYFQEAILCMKEKCNCTVNKQVHTGANYVTPLYSQKLALTSQTSSGCLVGIVCSQTQATEFKHITQEIITVFPPYNLLVYDWLSRLILHGV